MWLPVYLGMLHALEPDHLAVVSGISLSTDRRQAWKVGLVFGASHMLSMATLAVLVVLLGQALFGARVFLWLDRAAWSTVIALGLRNLWRAVAKPKLRMHVHVHRHGPIAHIHPHAHGPHAQDGGQDHRFHHAVAWLGAFFGLGGARAFPLLRAGGGFPLLGALLLFGLGITGTFVLLSAASGWLAARAGAGRRFRRGLLALSGAGNVAVGLFLLLRT
ncbi:MAG TPA: hypothetical protein VJ600_02720 [Holophagaceae bacterium]|nr:hypothetical protein [Holophagaceae bacterium]